MNNNHGDSRGIMKFLVRNAAPAGPSIQVEKLSPSDKIVKAEVLLRLASMEKIGLYKAWIVSQISSE